MSSSTLKRLTAALLCSVMVGASLISCSSDAPANNGTNDTTAADTTAETAAETADPSLPDVEISDYNGKEFHVFAPSWSHYKTSFFADGETGDVMNDAVFKRRTQTEEYLNLKLTHTIQGDVMKLYDTIRPIVMAGEDTYQLILTHFYHCVAAILSDGLLYDQNKIAAIDFSKPYWNHLVNENLNVDGHQYYSSSDMMMSETIVMLFNKSIVTNYKMEDPYELVRSGDWTIDKMLAMIETATKDLNGDSVIDHVNDQLGLTGEYWRYSAFLGASDIFLAEKDASAGLRLSLNGERTVKLTEKFDKLINGTKSTFTWKVNATDICAMDTGRVLFQMEELANFFKYRETDVDFGILPLPKYDSAQDQHYAIELSGFIGVPATVGDPEMAGKVLEMLAYFSMDTTQPVYYEQVLGEKLSRDADSKEMLNLIFDSIVVDPGRVWFGNGSAMGNLFYTIHNGIMQGEQFASWYAKHEEAANKEIAAFMESVRKIG